MRRARISLGVVRVVDMKDTSGVVDHYVLEAASGAKQRQTPLPCRTDGAQRAAKVPVGACRGDE